MIEEVKEVWVVLDGLDECDKEKGGRQELLLWMKEISTSQRTNVHLLATSRPEQDISSAIHKWSRVEQRICIQSKLISEDICEYIKKRVKEGEGFQRWNGNDDVQKMIVDKLMKKADGM